MSIILMQRRKNHNLVNFFLFFSGISLRKMVSKHSFSRYIELVRKHGLEISQPGLEPDKGLTWEMTKRRGYSEVHK